jgi:hypothetical protein
MDDAAIHLDPKPVGLASTIKTGLLCVLFGVGALYFDSVLRFICVVGFLAALGLMLLVRNTAENKPLILGPHSIRSGKTEIVFNDVSDIRMVDAKTWDSGTRNALIRALRMDGTKSVIALGSYARDSSLVEAIESYLQAASQERSEDIGPALARIRSLLERGMQ